MRLSEAIILGDSLKAPDPGQWLSPDGSCGCAFGGALIAAGAGISEFFGQNQGSVKSIAEAPIVRALWPWITAEHLQMITNLYYAVCNGYCVIEDVADYVRSVEPGEPVTPKTEMEEREMQVV